MPRLQHISGVVVDVDDATAALLGPEYEPASEESKADSKPGTVKRNPRTK